MNWRVSPTAQKVRNSEPAPPRRISAAVGVVRALGAVAKAVGVVGILGAVLLTLAELSKVDLQEAESETTANQPPILKMALSPDGRKLAIVRSEKGAEFTMRSIMTGDEWQCELVSSQPAHDVVFSPDSRYLAFSQEDDTLTLWAVDDEGFDHVWTTSHVCTAVRLLFTPDGKSLLSGDSDGTVTVWDVSSGTPKARHQVTSTRETARILDISQDGIFALVGWHGGKLAVWNLNEGKLSRTIGGNGSLPTAAGFSPDARQVVISTADRVIRLWDIETDRAVASTDARVISFPVLKFSPNGKSIVAGGVDGRIRVWDAQTLQPLTTLKGHTRCIRHLQFDTTGTTMYSFSWDATVRLWDLTDYRHIVLVDESKAVLPEREDAYL